MYIGMYMHIHMRMHMRLRGEMQERSEHEDGGEGVVHEPRRLVLVRRDAVPAKRAGERTGEREAVEGPLIDVDLNAWNHSPALVSSKVIYEQAVRRHCALLAEQQPGGEGFELGVFDLARAVGIRLLEHAAEVGVGDHDAGLAEGGLQFRVGDGAGT